MKSTSFENKIKFRNILILILLCVLFGGSYNYLNYPFNFIGYVEAFSCSILIGISIGFVQEFLLTNLADRIPLYQLLLVRTILYSLIVIAILILVLSIKISFDRQISYVDAMRYYYNSTLFDRDSLFAVTFVPIVLFVTQIIQLIGVRNLVRLIAGRYYQPREINRIFMFIDLNDSTPLAEKLGNKLFSSFIKDCFNDISSAINIYRGEIYQYVGDEVIVIWSIRRNNDHCLNCFFKVQRIIEEKKDYYLTKYGCVPQFKAGAHVGQVVVTEVGRLIKALVYHGDVLNTTSRIMGKCNELKQKILISKDLLALINQGNLDVVNFGEFPLKGKSNKISLYGISPQKASFASVN